MKDRIPLGVLFSQAGTYDRLGKACRDGVFGAIEAVNADPARRIRFELAERDPEGRIDRYAPLCAEF